MLGRTYWLPLLFLDSHNFILESYDLLVVVIELFFLSHKGEVLVVILDNFIVLSNWQLQQDVCRLANILSFQSLPEEVHQNSIVGVDYWEEEFVNEIIVICRRSFR